VSTASRLITYEDSFLLPEDKCEEIVRGELRRMPAPSVRHARLIERVASILRAQLAPDRFEVLVSAFGQVIRKDPFTYRVPDLGVYLRSGLTDDHYIWAVPELLVEVVSPANRKGDLNELIGDYDSLGVPELWLVDMEQRSTTILIRGSGNLRSSDMTVSERFPVKSSDLWNF
jgi:Uma2 family endonuclease